jgi:hypothetical protein
MNKNLKKLIISIIILGAWFFTADAYWISKERAVQKCEFENSIELLKHGRIEEITDAKFILYENCSWVMGAGNYWNTPRGMAYWEIILLLPVIHKLNFDR